MQQTKLHLSLLLCQLKVSEESRAINGMKLPIVIWTQFPRMQSSRAHVSSIIFARGLELNHPLNS